ncbi:hypothetical protein CSC35_1053 [Enterobacter hormaechei]|nr:hypothetical protein CSC35_1053 [Enterobacter hormaechei]
MIIYYLHHCNFRCTVSLLYVERWQIQRRGYHVKSHEYSSH